MTTVVFHKDRLYCDSLASCYDTDLKINFKSEACKIASLKYNNKKHIIGIAGSIKVGYDFRFWKCEGIKNSTTVNGSVISFDGTTVKWYETHIIKGMFCTVGKFVLVYKYTDLSSIVTIGTGSNFLKESFIEYSNSIFQAMKYAINKDKGSGGRIMSLGLNDKYVELH